MSDFADKYCEPCQKGATPLSERDVRPIINKVPGWEIIENHHLYREFTFPDFRQALDFVIEVGELAERENHHPDITLSWGKAAITLFTHKINGLHENDFILAAKINQI